MTQTASLRNAVASALLADVRDRDLPGTPAKRTQRIVMISQAVARSTGIGFARVRQMVEGQIVKTHPAPYMEVVSMGK